MVSFVPKNDRSVFPFKNLRIIPYQTYSGALNMALDFCLAQKTGADDTPVLRFYGWEPYCLSLGYHQDEKFVDMTAVKKAGYHVVRRPTGGSAIFHSEELTYGLIVPLGKINNHDVYYLFHRLLAQALNKLGFPVKLNLIEDKENYIRSGKRRFACFNRPAFTEIKYQNKKIVGSAQKLYKNALLQHGSVLLGPKQNEIINFMNARPEAKEEYLNKLKAGSVSLSEISSGKTDLLQIIEALLAEFENTLNINIFYQPADDLLLREAQKFVQRFKIQ
ncbi:MAG: lipoate--protein ligase family protein [Calditrichaeota bacterium]|nr:lipoate--protein ligase family protein [Calditrichota bacterium]